MATFQQGLERGRDEQDRATESPQPQYGTTPEGQYGTTPEGESISWPMI
jgi:hypothetical protein